MLDRKTLRGRLMLREFENTRKLVKELIQRRYEKTLKETGAGKAVPQDALTKEEERLHRSLRPLAESHQTFLEGVLRGRSISSKTKMKPKTMVLRFTQDIPAIIGLDMQTYGPFKAEDIATLPVENARIFLEKALAVKVRITAQTS